MYTAFKNIIFQEKSFLKKAGFFFASQILLLLIGIGLKKLQTNILHPEQYGSYAFFSTVIGFVVIFFRFGFFDSLRVLLAESKSKEESAKLFGVGIIAFFGIGFLFSLTIWILSFFVDSWFNSSVGNILRLYSPLVFVFVFKYLIDSISVGTEKLMLSSWYDVLAKGMFLMLLVYSVLYNESLDVSGLIFFNLITMLAATVSAIAYIRPSFRNLNSSFKQLWDKNKEYGIHYYSGAIVNQSTYKMDEFFVAGFVSTVQLGFYNLVNFLCTPMLMFSQALSSAYFKKMSNLTSIPKNLFLINTLWLLGSFLLLVFSGNYLVDFLFGAEYSEVADLIPPMGVVFIFHGLCTPYIFLSVKSMGKEIRNISLMESVVNIVGMMTLIPTFGLLGAIYGSALSRLTHFLGLHYYYRKSLLKK